MSDKNIDIKNRILLSALDNVPFDGWQWSVVEQAAEDEGFDTAMALAVFPDKMEDVLLHFSNWADEQMLDKLNEGDFSGTRVRDKIEQAVIARLDVLSPYKESVQKAAVYWIGPSKSIQAGKSIWKTADLIWVWAGDTSDDYNHYTKRALLSGVITTTMLRWLNDSEEGYEKTKGFLNRRINNVLTVGQKTGKVISSVSKILSLK
ncbi:MAG: COQ9 family protein [Pseudomonadota bacterium]